LQFDFRIWRVRVEKALMRHGASLEHIDAHLHQQSAAMASIDTHLHRIIERLRHMATQEDIDTLTAQVTALSDTLATETSELDTATAAILAEIDTLTNANPALDVSGLTAAVESVSTATSNIKAAADSVQSIPPAAPVEPTDPTAPVEPAPVDPTV
jgi:uncharacterized phage infection (PIP) family protein YhgE